MRTFLIITVGLLSQTVAAQRNSAYLELGGNGGFASLNYEWQLTDKPQLSIRTGLGATFFEFEKDRPDTGTVSGCAICGVNIFAPRVSLTLPFSVQYLFDVEHDNFLETGLGSTLQWSDNSIFIFYANLGFRRYFGNGRHWMWKVNFTPLLGISGKNAIKDSEPTIWGGLSIGKRF